MAFLPIEAANKEEPFGGFPWAEMKQRIKGGP
jgi:hypothetical protein